jgi:carbon monoxide dehydrogenase subunit G
MASIRQEIRVAASAEHIWDAVRDVGEIHHRLVPGFVTDCRLEGDARIVTFANGLVAREVIVDVDDEARRVVWSATGERLTHHNASLQVFAEDAEHSQLVWIADLLPDKMKQPISGMIEQGMLAMKATLEAQVAGRRNQ